MIRTIRWSGFALIFSGAIVLAWYLLSKIWEPLREVLPWWKELDGPVQFGVAAAAIGFVILMSSVTAERWQDWSREKREPDERY